MVSRSRTLARRSSGCFDRPLALAKLVVANHRLPAPRGESRAARLAIAVRTGTFLRRHEIEHVHAHWSYPADVAYLLAPLLGLSVSLTAHAHDIYEDIPLYEQHGLPYSRRAQQARFVVTCTSTNYEHVRALLPEALRERIHLVYHGLDLSHFAPNGVVPVEPPLIVTVGRQVWCKGFDVVIGAARILRDNGRSFRCAIVGPPGPETSQLNGLIDDYDLRDRVELVGPRRQDELRDLYARGHGVHERLVARGRVRCRQCDRRGARDGPSRRRHRPAPRARVRREQA